MNQDDSHDPAMTTQDMQKKFRNTEYDRKAYADETTANIKRQRYEIENILTLQRFDWQA